MLNTTRLLRALHVPIIGRLDRVAYSDKPQKLPRLSITPQLSTSRKSFCDTASSGMYS